MLEITRRKVFAALCVWLFAGCAAPASRPELLAGTAGVKTPAGTEEAVRRKIAQMLMVGFRGAELTADNHIYRDVAELGIGGVLLFDYDMPSRSRPRNIQSKEQLARLCAALRDIAPAPLFIAIDQEGGRVNRLRGEYGFPVFPGARDMAADSSGKTTKAQAEKTAALLADMGVNLNFAPCVDLDLNPANPIIGAYGRSFSADPAVVIKHAALWIEAHRRRGVISAVKHFPGHGSSAGDTHRGQVDVTGFWQETELEPYRRLLGGGFAGSGALPGNPGEYLMVMTSHVFNADLDPQSPATLSAPVLSGLLREKLGWRGIIVSDDMDMDAIKANYGFEEALEKAVNAGVDLICLSNNGGTYDPALAQKAADALYRYVETGRITAERIEESWNRIMAVKRTL